MQLKRNKEMEFETLKKSHKKQIVIGALAICVIGGALTFATTRAKYKLTQDINIVKGEINYKPYDFKVMAMYKSEDGTNYAEINTMPTSGYVINEDKTYCTTNNKTQIKGKIKTVDENYVISNLTRNDKCYLYFDKKKTVSETILSNITVKASIPDFGQVATADEGVYAVSDGMYGGTSYYWRGATSNNYVKFANFCWRIVKINGDGTIRLIYDGTTCHANGTSTAESIAVTNQAYNSLYNQSNYVGWTYSGTSQRVTSGTSSNAKAQIESWYNTNLLSYVSRIVDGKFCNDRNTTPESSWALNPSLSFGYAANGRLVSAKMPTLSCANSGDVYILKIGTITADEVAFAGGVNGAANQSYYLYNGQNYWTMTPYSSASGGTPWIFDVQSNGKLEASYVASSRGLRPVINLKADITISSGNGTLNNPYIVQ